MQKKLAPKSTFDPVLEFVFSRIEPDVALLRYMLSLLDPHVQERFIYALAKIYNPLEMIENLPEHSRPCKDDATRTYISFTVLGYNYLENEVHYECESIVHRHFKNEEDAKAYAETGKLGDYNGWEWGNKPSETHPFVGSHTNKDTGSCSYERWIENAE